MKIIIANLHLCQFGGSELVSVELAEFYASLGYNVTLYSPQISAPLIQTIKRDKITLTVTKPSLEELHTFDIVWSHHGLLLDEINTVNKKPHQLIVSNHMSSWLDIELPKYGADQVDVILANSEETRSKMSDAHKSKCQLFQNPAPQIKWAEVNNNRKKPLALSISNHRPPELITFMGTHQDKIDFELIGLKTQNYIRLSAQKIFEINPDFVICNGKSVQYALAAGVPVFLYDNFFGCGWLNEDNFMQAEYFNFSGRGFNITPALETMLGFESVSAIEMTEKRQEKFILEKRIKKLGLY